MGEPSCKAERLALAGAVAPVLRAAKDNARRVAKVNEHGEIVGYTTLGEVREALLAAKKIEIEVEEGKRPKETICKACGAIFRVSAKGPIARICRLGCRCVDCGEFKNPTSRGHRCMQCARKIAPAALTPAQRSEIKRKAWRTRRANADGGTA